MSPVLRDLRPQFSAFLGGDPHRLHFAAHSHHPWPDASRAGHLQVWDDAARLIDGKWDRVLGPVLAAAQGHVARNLRLPDPQSVVFAPNTHELAMRLLSSLPVDRPARVLTTDSEFHSFARQLARLEEDGLVTVERIAAEPFDDFGARFAAAARAGGHDLVWLSSVFFNSGFAVPDLDAIIAAADPAALLVVDGYHAFMALPVDWSAFAGRAFFIAGGYKYAMAGEGACFMHCPPGQALRPRDTGWYAAFGALSSAQDSRVPYAESGWRFMGATFDPSGLYRFNAVQDWLLGQGLGVADIHAHVQALQALFLARLPCGPFTAARLVVRPDQPHGHFLTFALDDAAAVHDRLHRAGIVTDRRGDRIRFGFGLYQTEAEVMALAGRIAGLT